MSIFKIIEDRLWKECKIGIELLREELDFQKHRASDKLYDGFYGSLVIHTDRIVMSIMNNTHYMWKVNGTPPNGRTAGVRATMQELTDWALKKQDKGELKFDSPYALHRFVQKVKHELMQHYLTDGGQMVAPRRYFFIDIVVKEVKKRQEGIETDLDKQIKELIGYKKNEKSEKPFKMVIS
jgi:hypothetical protein